MVGRVPRLHARGRRATAGLGLLGCWCAHARHDARLPPPWPAGAWACTAVKLIAENTCSKGDKYVPEVKMYVYEEEVDGRCPCSPLFTKCFYSLSLLAPFGACRLVSGLSPARRLVCLLPSQPAVGARAAGRRPPALPAPHERT